jgi:hypothetical protein
LIKPPDRTVITSKQQSIRGNIMNKSEKNMRQVLARIAELATVGEENDSYSENELDQLQESFRQQHGNGPSRGVPICRGIKSLPVHQLHSAAQKATEKNPVNAPIIGAIGAVNLELPIQPAFLTVLTSKYWRAQPRRLTVSFMESTPSELRTKIVKHMNAWTRTICISFVETRNEGDVRISRESGGYWSYLGTDITLVGHENQTMNLEGFSTNTRDEEFYRVVRHETGHTLGFPHEHMRKELVERIDRKKAYDYFWRTQRWNKETVDQQVLTSLDEKTILGTPADQTSIMCYQLPGDTMRDGKAIPGGKDINETDYAFAGKVYPKHKEIQTSEFEGEHQLKEVPDEVFY